MTRPKSHNLGEEEQGLEPKMWLGLFLLCQALCPLGQEHWAGSEYVAHSFTKYHGACTRSSTLVSAGYIVGQDTDSVCTKLMIQNGKDQ